MSATDLLKIADQLAEMQRSFDQSHSSDIEKITNVISKIAKSWSGSFLGYHANVYKAGLQPPNVGEHFSIQTGLDDHWPIPGTIGDWREFRSDLIKTQIFTKSDPAELDNIRTNSDSIRENIERAKAELSSILSIEVANNSDNFLQEQLRKIQNFTVEDKTLFARAMIPSGKFHTQDMRAASQGFRLPPHLDVMSDILAFKQPAVRAKELSDIARQAGSHIFRLERKTKKSELVGTNIFIGHGRSSDWRILKEFIKDRLGLPFDEFNRVPVAGLTNIARLSEMLDAAAIAFLILTAEDELADGKTHARMNVIHEVGLFQGRLGFTRAIVLLEQGCEEFSNIQGLGQIRFPRGNISAAFEEIRRVLEREKIVEG